MLKLTEVIMSISQSKVLFVSFALFATLLVAPFLASKATADEESQSKDFMLPTVEVTAEKREMDAQKTPMTMDVITAQDIEDAGIKTIDDVFKRIPNLVVSTQFLGGAAFMTYRGVHSSVSTETNPIVFYVDDVPMESFQAIDVNLANIERIEILKGAQGVIYGKNAFAGIIRIITKKPSNELTGKTFAGADIRGGYDAGGTVSGPIVEDRLLYSLTLSHEYDKGYLRTEGDTKRENKWNNRAKGQLLFTPSDKSNVALHFDYARMDMNRPQYGVSEATVTMNSLASDSDKENTKALNLALNGNFVLDDFTFDTITTQRFENNKYTVDYQPINGMGESGRANDRSEITQEFRISSNDDAEGLRWLTGIYGSYTDWHMYDGYFDMGFAYEEGTARIYSTEVAPFGQVQYPFADAWTLTAGLRWFTLHREARLNHEIAAMGVDVHIKPEGTWSELLPRINLSYDIDDDKMLYAGVSRSAIPGGFNYLPFSPTEKVKYDTQTAWNYEMGAKTQWLDDTLRINPVVFYSKYYDVQELLWNGVGFSASNPGKEATAYGVELDMVYLVTPEIQADANMGYTKAKYDKYDSSSGGTSGVGKRMVMSPEYTGRVGLQYRGASGFFARGDVNYVSSIYWDGANTYKRDPVTTVDARVGWESESFDVYVYGKNILGARYLGYFSTGNKLAFTADPGTYGFEFAYRF
ncbi:TonB-dependent receptor plug domain-containing protein [Pseudodesulfovibrio sp. F-1]|uniref:TonB-dependent receptor plug domain-containing protein n=1 Tax=Pseudodesulfovibrio alkaliphilus TaxID=2661613 RepID=A0A7K1KQU9_9BACT|nr:TonB-dependent receptor [Pseudodesulfovibrio alkaliphilus]MUM78475.1 TonB-dependent receptor plug domain-containing protein [Pseudodesulfovibrio alkaliphilus]